jgi:glycosyltransferase involved in cell wall biosynthesis
MIRHGENGWLVEARDQNALAKAMLTLFGDKSLRRQLGREGRRAAIARFSTNRFLKEVEELYGDLLDRGGMPQRNEAARNFEVNLSPD